MSILVVIPARLESTRLPRKLLLDETGQSLIQHTYQAASTSRLADHIVVAADDQAIVDRVRQFGGNACLTGINHTSGTDRLAEVVEMGPYKNYDVIVNVQGDEPEVLGEDIDLAIEQLLAQPEACIATLATPVKTGEQLWDPGCVKVVVDSNGRAMYFSRSPLPHPRAPQEDQAELVEQWLAKSPAPFLQHIGVYVYRREFLLEFSSLPVPVCEQLESLEQLRALHAGRPIAVAAVAHAYQGIDTRKDYQEFVDRYHRSPSSRAA